MARRLVPQKKLSKLELNIWNVTLSVLIGLAVSFTISFIVVLFMKSGLEKNIQAVNDRLDDLNHSEIGSKEREVRLLQKKMATYREALDSHNINTSFFSLLEEETHKEVFLRGLDLDAQEEKAIVFGETESFSSLREQLLVWRKQELINEVSLSKTEFNNKGGVDFTVLLSLKEDVFK